MKAIQQLKGENDVIHFGIVSPGLAGIVIGIPGQRVNINKKGG